MISNTDPKELEHFNTIAEDWWDPNGAFKTLHEINPLRLEFITQALDLQNKKTLDVGCGGGILTESLARNGANVIGIDASNKAIQAAATHAVDQSLAIEYELTTAEEFAEAHANQFDLITCMELLEHVPDPHSVITACAKTAKPGADLFFSTLNRTLKAYAFAIIGAEYVLRLLPKGMHNYEKFIRPSELSQWGRQAGLTLERIIGISYSPLNKVYRLGNKVDVNYIVHFRKG